MPIQPLESANLRVITDNTGRMVDIIDAQGDSIGVVGSKANDRTGLVELWANGEPVSVGGGVDAAELDAAVVAAQAARDAAIIGAGVYTTEPIGRAAVADGVAFKVQGTGDIAAYEYRRTNSTTSVLIATYPSASGAAKPTERIIGDYGVAAGATNFIGAVGTNLFNYLEAITGYTISGTTGDLSVSAANSVSALIPVTEALHYYVHAAYFPRIAWYSANLGFISSTTTTGDVVAPAGARYLRAVCANAAVSYAYINAGAVSLGTEPYRLGFLTRSGFKTPTLGRIVTGANSNVNFLSPTKRLVIAGGTTRLITPEASWLFPATDIAWPAPGTSRLEYNPTTNTIAFVASSAALDAKKVVFGTVSVLSDTITVGGLDHYTIDGASAAVTKTPLTTVKRLSINGPVDAGYVSAAMPSFGSIAAAAHTTIYALYDALVSAYPNYVTRTSLGLDDSGKTIYKYEFKPPVLSTGLPRAFPKMVLVSGVHGLEKAGVHCLYLALKAICDEWAAYPALETLRWNAHLIVIPVAVPYAFDNFQRKNENGIDIARNFPTGWTLVDSGLDTYGGTAALSEKSSQYINTVLTANPDAIYFGSFHNFFTPTDPNTFVWNASATQFGVDLAESLISRQSRNWKSRFAWLPQDDVTLLGTATAAPDGSEGKHATAYHGIQGGTFEIGVLVSGAPDATAYSTHTATLGKEAVVNWLALTLDKASALYNSRAI